MQTCNAGERRVDSPEIRKNRRPPSEQDCPNTEFRKGTDMLGHNHARTAMTNEETIKTYRIEIIEEIKATSPGEALRGFLDRLENEETEASVEHIATGTKYLLECQTGKKI